MKLNKNQNLIIFLPHLKKKKKNLIRKLICSYIIAIELKIVVLSNTNKIMIQLLYSHSFFKKININELDPIQFWFMLKFVKIRVE